MAWSMEIIVAITAFFAFWMILYFIGKKFKLEKRGIKIDPLLIMWRTQKANRFIDSAAKKLSRTLPIFADLSIALAIGITVFASYFFILNLLKFIWRPAEAGGVLLLLPGITIGPESLPYFLIALVIVLVPHEFAHGIVTRFEGINIKSAGLLLLAILPGGFVEPDEESFKKAETRKRARILAVGGSTNLATALIVMIFVANSLAFYVAISPCYQQSSGIVFVDIIPGYPIASSGLQPGDALVAINGTKIDSMYSFQDYMRKIGPNETLVLKILFNNGSYGDVNILTVSASDNSSRGIIGIAAGGYFNYYPPRASFLSRTAPFYIYKTLVWIYVITFGVTLVNMLPIYPLDGGQLVNVVLEKYVKKHVKIIRSVISVFFIAILVMNFTLSFMLHGLISL